MLKITYLFRSKARMLTWRGNFRASILSSEDVDRRQVLTSQVVNTCLAVTKDYLDSLEKNHRMIPIKRKEKLSVES